MAVRTEHREDGAWQELPSAMLGELTLLQVRKQSCVLSCFALGDPYPLRPALTTFPQSPQGGMRMQMPGAAAHSLLFSCSTSSTLHPVLVPS